MAADYKQVYDGDVIVLRHGQKHYIQCCDCGLVHEYKPRKVPVGVAITVTVDRRKTAAVRRWKKKKGARNMTKTERELIAEFMNRVTSVQLKKGEAERSQAKMPKNSGLGLRSLP